jgi:hypothetical protein
MTPPDVDPLRRALDAVVDERSFTLFLAALARDWEADGATPMRDNPKSATTRRAGGLMKAPRGGQRSE